LRGGDAYLKDKVSAQISSLIEERDINIDVFNDDVFGALDTLSVPPLIGEFRLVILKSREVKLSDKEKDALLRYVRDPVYGSILLIDDTADTFKFLSKDACIVECNSSDDYYILGWIRLELNGYEIGAGSAELLLKLGGKDMQRISGELSKLRAYAARTKKITVDIINDLVPKDADIQVFELTNHLSRKEYESAISVYNALTLRGADSMHLMSLLVNQYRRMLYAAISPLSLDGLAEVLRIKEYAVTMAKKSAANYTKAGLRKIVDMLTTLEYEFKSGAMSDKAALDCAVAYLAAA
jgi:DNA polymerase-3 subunit delta